MTADTRSDTGPDPQTLDTVQSIMKDVRTCMFVTRTEDGSLHAAPMTTQEAEFDGDAWFLAGSGSETIRNLRSQPHVNVSYAGSNAWLSLSGTASVVDDAEKKKELWNALTEAWSPGGEDDPSVVVVKVSGESAHYWDSPGRLAMALDMVKARVTGHPPKSGDTGSVDLDN
jgi:general stress protein 26